MKKVFLVCLFFFISVVICFAIDEVTTIILSGFTHSEGALVSIVLTSHNGLGIAQGTAYVRNGRAVIGLLPQIRSLLTYVPFGEYKLYIKVNFDDFFYTGSMSDTAIDDLVTRFNNRSITLVELFDIMPNCNINRQVYTLDIDTFRLRW